eukprot:NODE_255_length_12751_cov_0.188587.p9 type:complete len:104 gc:universal NODE_255_length_12751_cov_0.188587:12204-12515(+)
MKDLKCIVWGNGSKAHVRGNDPVPNRLLLHQFSRWGQVLIIPEEYTSKKCYNCKKDFNGKEYGKRKRLRTCETCSTVLDRDVNASLNIRDVFISFTTEYKKPI